MSGSEKTQFDSLHRLIIWKVPALGALLCGLILWTFWPATRNGFILYDDPQYIWENGFVQGGLTWQGLRWAFTTSEAANWHPITWISHMLDCQLFGVQPWGHHFTSVFVHTINGLLVFLLLKRLTGTTWRSWIIAALFALHPLRVESVAWVAERKDVLSTFFGLLSLMAYGRYAQRCRGSKVESRVKETRTPSLSHTHSRTLTRPSGTLSHPMGEGRGEGSFLSTLDTRPSTTSSVSRVGKQSQKPKKRAEDILAFRNPSHGFHPK
ncbi:MAG TPA: hypothetical protein VFD66_11315, partial [Verrucomicrobiae bacterium]|nr:hypothetical protein [Verrucomicrobiae bacterium]